MNALLFPGQGVQKVGMLNGIFDIEDETKDFIKSAANDLDFDLVELITSGPRRKIKFNRICSTSILPLA
jgi:(acyl-carrier-protein) S-malonyltransferase